MKSKAPAVAAFETSRSDRQIAVSGFGEKFGRETGSSAVNQGKRKVRITSKDLAKFEHGLRRPAVKGDRFDLAANSLDRVLDICFAK